MRNVFKLAAFGAAAWALALVLLSPAQSLAEEVPAELRAEPPGPSNRAKALSQPFIEATRKVRAAVVKIVNYQVDWGGRLRPVSGGSGFVISSEGHVLTNRHVVLNARLLVVETADGRRFDKVKQLGEDPRSDVAILRVLELGDEVLPVAPLGDSDHLDVGEWVIAIGAPFELESSVSVGVVSATGRTGVLRSDKPAEEFIQTDAALNPGNSGGPLINLDGQVVGINTAIETGGFTRSSAGVGFAIPINLVRSIAISLIERGVATRGWLGVRFQDTWVMGDELRQLGVEAPRALRVEFVEPGSPAAKAGMEKGDIITEVDGRPIRSIQILFARLTQAGPGGTVEFLMHRGGQARRLGVHLGETQAIPYGIEVADLAPAKAGEIGLPPDTRGALVTRVDESSPVHTSTLRNGIMPGDVIVRVDWPGGQKVIAGKDDLMRLMAQFEADPPSAVRFVLRMKEGYFQVVIRP